MQPDAFRQATNLRLTAGRFAGLPGPAKLVVFVAAVPGILIAVVALILFLVSILALLLLTVPAYRLLAAVCGVGPTERAGPDGVNPFLASLFGRPFGAAAGDDSPGRKQVAARVVDAEQ